MNSLFPIPTGEFFCWVPSLESRWARSVWKKCAICKAGWGRRRSAYCFGLPGSSATRRWTNFWCRCNRLGSNREGRPSDSISPEVWWNIGTFPSSLTRPFSWIPRARRSGTIGSERAGEYHPPSTKISPRLLCSGVMCSYYSILEHWLYEAVWLIYGWSRCLRGHRGVLRLAFHSCHRQLHLHQ